MLKNPFMLEAIKQAKKALEANEVPIGCIIVDLKTKQIIAKAYNKTSKNALLHAEIIALNKALVLKKNAPLKDCALYVTLEPCLMCYGAIAQSGLKQLYYGLPCLKTGAVESNSLIDDAKCANLESYGHFYENEIEELMQSFFKNKR